MDHDPAALPQDNVDDSDSIGIRLTQPTLIIESGGPPVDNLAILTNPTQAEASDQYAFMVDGLDPAWVNLNVKSVLLLRGDSSQVRLRFTVPRRGAAEGEYTYRVTVQSLSKPAVTTSTTGFLRISSPATLQMTLSPATATGLTAQYTAHLLSGPSGDLVVDMIGQDPSNALAFTPTPARLRLGPDQEATVTLDVGIKPEVVGEPRAYPFTLVADLSAGDEGEVPVAGQAEFVYVPDVRLDMQVELVRMHGQLGDYRLVLTNPTSLMLGVELEAFDPHNALDIFFSGENDDDLRVGREQTVTLKTLVRVAEEVPLGETRTYPFTIRAHVRNVDGPGEADQAVECELVYQAQAGPVVTAAALRMDLLDRVRLALSPPQAVGMPAHFTAQVENQGEQGVLLVLDAQDADQALDYSFDPPQIYLGPGAQRDAALAVTLRPDAPGANLEESRSYPFEVRCWAPAGDDRRLTVPGVLVRPYIPSADSIFRAILTPITPSGPEGSYDVRLINGSALPLRVVVRGRDPRGLLTFTLTSRPVALAPAEAQNVRLLVRPNALEPLSEEHTYPFEVICWLPGTDKMHALQGELRYVSF
jgi:hypothetical protein